MQAELTGVFVQAMVKGLPFVTGEALGMPTHPAVKAVTHNKNSKHSVMSS
jgi:hypothetical protein